LSNRLNGKMVLYLFPTDEENAKLILIMGL